MQFIYALVYIVFATLGLETLTGCPKKNVRTGRLKKNPFVENSVLFCNFGGSVCTLSEDEY